MLKIIRNLWLGLFILALISVILLATDKSKPAAGNKEQKKNFKLAMFKHSSRPLLDSVLQGAEDALAKRGYKEGENLTIKRYSAENDMVTANSIAKEIAQSDFNMVLTASTPCLQVMANANKEGKVIHLFAAVTDPYGAGVGIDESDHLKHPKHLAGVGTFQPVESAFRLAKKMNPNLKYVGTPWTTSEKCAEACVKKARIVCKELGITLLEVPVENSTAILEACKSLCSQGAQALWVGGDNNVELALDVVVKSGFEAGIPVFGNAPDHADKGALFGIGGNYYEVGKVQGNMAADILEGKEISTIPIDNIVPEKLFLNKKTQSIIREKWNFPEDVCKIAAKIIDVNGESAAANSGDIQPSVKPAESPKSAEIVFEKINKTDPNKKFNFFLILYNDSKIYEDSEKGIIDGLKECGLEKNKDYTITVRNANGQIADLNTICDTANSSQYDIVFVAGTPTLQNAIKKIQNIPIVFTTASDPITAGAGKNFEEHLPNVTGISTRNDIDKYMLMLKKIFPDIKKMGTLFNPGEVNSVTYKTDLVSISAKYGLSVEAVPVESANEIINSAQVLCSKPIDIILQVMDNTSTPGFSSIDKVAKSQKLPVFSFLSETAEKGYSIMTLSRDYYDASMEAAECAVKILNGKNPHEIPIRFPRKSKITINLDTAKFYSVEIPRDIIDSADKVIGK